jgi:hypothetical protein
MSFLNISLIFLSWQNSLMVISRLIMISAFTTPLELMDFVKLLRKGSEGKPIGIKICIGNKSEFLSICKAMVETKTYLDFITVDGGEGGTGTGIRDRCLFLVSPGLFTLGVLRDQIGCAKSLDNFLLCGAVFLQGEADLAGGQIAFGHFLALDGALGCAA